MARLSFKRHRFPAEVIRQEAISRRDPLGQDDWPLLADSAGSPQFWFRLTRGPKRSFRTSS